MPLTAAHLRRLADEIEAEEEQAKQDLEKAEKEQASEKRIAELEARLEKLADARVQTEEQLEQREEERAADQPSAEDELEERRQKRTRPGRKSGHLYQDEQTGEGYVYDGPDEPEHVELDDEDEVA